MTILPNGVSIPVQHEEEPFFPPSQCDNWTVTLDPTLDPEEFVLNVEATCPPGEAVELQRVSPRGENPKDLWLKETARTATAPAGETPTPNRIKYRQRTRVAYTRVMILPGGPVPPGNASPQHPGPVASPAPRGSGAAAPSGRPSARAAFGVISSLPWLPRKVMGHATLGWLADRPGLDAFDGLKHA